MEIIKKIVSYFKNRKIRRLVLKTIRQNFKAILDECKEVSLKYKDKKIPIKFYGKILKESRAVRNIKRNNLAADYYDNALKVMYNTTVRVNKNFKGNNIGTKDIKTSLDEMYKHLKRII